MKKLIASLLVLCMMAALALNAAAIDWSSVDTENVPYSVKAPIVTPGFKPTVDAVKDAGYTTSYEVKESFGNYIAGTTVSTAWSGNTLYFYIEVPDTTPQESVDNLWNYQRDGVWFLLYFGGNQADHVIWRSDAAAKTFKIYPALNQINFTDSVMQENIASPSESDFEFMVDYQADGYKLEVAYTVPTSVSTLTAGQEIAFDIEVFNCNDDPNARYYLVNPNENSTENYCTAYGAKLVLQEAAAPAGELVEVDGNLFYQENGVGVMAGLVKVGDDYYFAGYNGKIVKNKLQNIWANATGEDAFTGKNRVFGADGKLASGLVTVGDDVYYCVDGKPTMAGLVKDGDDVYFIGGEGKAIKNKIQNIWKNDSGDETFTGKNRAFGEDGKLLTGILNDVYYEDGVAKMAGLVEVDGDYYFAGGAGVIVKDKVQYIWANSTDNADLTGTNQTFDADGKLAG